MLTVAIVASLVRLIYGAPTRAAAEAAIDVYRLIRGRAIGAVSKPSCKVLPRCKSPSSLPLSCTAASVTALRRISLCVRSTFNGSVAVPGDEPRKLILLTES